MGDAHFIASRFDEALKFHRQCLAERSRVEAPGLRPFALVGDVEEAQRMARNLLANHPHLTLERIAKGRSFEPPHEEIYLEGLRRAGFS
jgi:hypothetical protein